MEQPFVSVYIPTRNRSYLLQRALASVVRQTYRPLEVIVVDDGSTDDTPQVLATMGQSNSGLVVIRNEVSCGAAAARNKAIEAAHGEFVTGLDDDDEFLPDRIRCFVEDWQAREQRGEKFCGLYAQDISRAGNREAITRKPAQVCWEDLFRMNLINNQVFTRRSHLQTIGMFDSILPMWQDLECWIRLTATFGPARLTDAVSYVFHLDAATHRISSGGKDRLRQAYEHVARKHAVAIGPSQRRDLFLQMYADHYPTEVRWEDVCAFVTLFGPDPRGTARLTRLMLRQRARAVVRKSKGVRS